ncbi:MAG TPA: translation elongation factor 4, partial [Planctomycetota bacterium]|nr:translation elongation factor 4 [Planctomycetota bacterium]
SHEVRRALMSCEGALLIVDAAQGVEAQTVANLYVALEYNLEIVPVINKIDLPAADVDRVREEIDSDLGLDPFEAVLCSAKNRVGIEDVLNAIVEKLPAPQGDSSKPLQALIFDAQYDPYRGVVLLVRVKEGTLKKGQVVRLMHSEKSYEVEELGLLGLKRVPVTELTAGMVGYVIANIKTIRDIEIGDTVTDARAPAKEPLPGYKEAKPVVFSSMYPMTSDDYEDLLKALEKLALNDAAFTFQKSSSAALGFGFRYGFLGLLHIDIVQERLERENDMSLILSAPTVLYKVKLKDGSEIEVDNPIHYPDPTEIEQVEEPYIKASIIIPDQYVGPVMELCREHRASEMRFDYLSVGRVEVKSELPLAEVLFEFYDKLKTITRGYGSFDYELDDYRPTRIVKVEILVNHERVDALCQLVHEDRARERALRYCEKLAKTIPKHQFKIPIQGAIGSKVIARTTINAFRKDVTAKCYGGDITRKRKLLEKQKKGKQKMKMVGSVQIPQEAFVAVLKSDKEE